MAAFCITISIMTGSIIASEGVDDLIKLQKADIDREIMLAFVQDSKIAYDLSADEIQKLEDAGVPATVVVAMLDHGKQIRGEPVPAAPTENASATTANSANPANPASPVQTTSPDAQPVANDTPPVQEPPRGPEPFAGASSTVVTAPPPDGANLSTFYESMSPYGTWTQDPAHGWVWQPSVVTAETQWQPYSQGGHWSWTDHGWYWESTYPWGWAAFHYGRWTRSPERGWVWVPDTVWGSAWVDWRQSDTYYGWAPLPPDSRFEPGIGFTLQNNHVGFDLHLNLSDRDYAFVPAERFLDVDLRLALVPKSRTARVYQQTTAINNSYAYNDNRVINKGVSPAIVSQKVHREIKASTVVDAKIAAGQPIRGEQRAGDRIVSYRPVIANTAPVDPKTVMMRQRVVARAKVEAVTYRLKNEATRNDRDSRTHKAERPENLRDNNAREPRVDRSDSDSEREARQRLNAEKARRVESRETGSVPVQRSPSRMDGPATPVEERRETTHEIVKDHRGSVDTERELRGKAREETREEKTRDEKGRRGNDK